MFLAGIIVLLIVILLLALVRASFLVTTIAIVACALALIVLLSAFWVVLLVLWLPLSIPALRQKLFSKKLFKFFHNNMPEMSRTEREAIEAGDVWWDAELFSGKPRWHEMMRFKPQALTDEEQSFLDNQVNTLCHMLDDWNISHELKDLPPEVWEYLKQEKFFGMVIEKKYGGLGFSAIAHSTVIQKIATRSPSAAIVAMVPNSLGPGELIHRYGTEQQQTHYMPRLASGEEIPCFALTGPFAGSDAASMRDTGVVCYGEHNGEKVLGIKLSWDKHYITLAPVATILGLAFKLYDPDHLIGDQDEIGITLCLVPTNHEGVQIGRRHFPMGMAFMNGPTQGQDVFVPMDWVIGGQAMVGQGWRMLMECLSIGRSISLPSISTASAKHAYRMTGAYAMIREQFNLPIAKFEGVSKHLSEIAGFAYLMESMRIVTCGAVDAGHAPAIVSAIAKYHATEMFRTVCNHAMDVHGGRAVQYGPRNYLGSAYQGVPVAITVEGANILTRNLIIFGQGLMRCHPYLLKEIESVHLPDQEQGLKQFDKVLVKHMGYTLSNLIRSLFFGLTVNALTRSPIQGQFAKVFKSLTRMSSTLALTADMSLLVLGGDLKRKENLSARLGDVMSYLFMASCVLHQYQNGERSEEARVYTEWACQYCLHQIQVAFDDFFFNFPNKALAKILRFCIFPYGRSFKKPSDKLGYKVVKPMLEDSSFRSHLTKDVFIGESEQDITTRTELAFKAVLAADEAKKKVRQAVREGHIKKSLDFAKQVEAAQQTGLINESEVELINHAMNAMADVVRVDDFSPEYLKGDV